MGEKRESQPDGQTDRIEQKINVTSCQLPRVKLLAIRDRNHDRYQRQRDRQIMTGIGEKKRK